MKVSKRIDRIRHKLTRTGANFATTFDKYIDPSDPVDARPTYHIHPDCKNPHANLVQRFQNLNNLEGYANARLTARKASDEYANQFDCPTGEAAIAVNLECARLQAEVMQNFWDGLN